MATSSFPIISCSHKKRQSFFVLAQWAFLSLGALGVIAGGIILATVDTNNDDGRKISFAAIVALLSGILLLVQVLRGSESKRAISR